MIFDTRQAKAIARGVKTQHRVPVLPARAKVGHDYAVRRDVRVTVLGRRRVLLGDITHRDARAEGHRTTDEFRCGWVRRYDKAWLARERFGLVDDVDDLELVALVDGLLRDRFEARWAKREAWCIDLALVTDAAQYLARQGDILAGGPQYTPIKARAIDPIEAVCGPWLDREARRRAEHGERMRASFRRDLEEERARRSTTGLSNRALRHINRADDRNA